jgi:hypothetical protein
MTRALSRNDGRAVACEHVAEVVRVAFTRFEAAEEKVTKCPSALIVGLWL